MPKSTILLVTPFLTNSGTFKIWIPALKLLFKKLFMLLTWFSIKVFPLFVTFSICVVPTGIKVKSIFAKRPSWSFSESDHVLQKTSKFPNYYLNLFCTVVLPHPSYTRFCVPRYHFCQNGKLRILSKIRTHITSWNDLDYY